MAQLRWVCAAAARAGACPRARDLAAYSSDESGRNEVYLDSWPDPRARLQVSLNGGRDPHWTADGRRLFFREADRLMVATLSTMSPISVLSREPFGLSIPASYDVLPDGLGVLYAEAAADRGDLLVVMNWLTEMRARIAASRGGR